MSDQLNRIVAAVNTHNRLVESDAMWQQHRQQQRGEREPPQAVDRQRELQEARAEVAARKLAARQAEESGASAAAADEDDNGRKRKRRKEDKDDGRKKDKRKKHKKKDDKKEKRKKRKHDSPDVGPPLPPSPSSSDAD